MADQVFISYSRKNQEFATRLAADLDARVEGVWFDRSDIQAGEAWRESIAKGIRGCKVFILVISPESVASKEVRWELDAAREARRRIIPVIYKTTQLPADLDKILREIQHIDLRKGSYADNFEVLIEGLVAGGVTHKGELAKRGFLREPVKVDRKAVRSRIPGWAFAWGLGWGAFWLIVTAFIMILMIADNSFDPAIFPIGLGLGVVGGLGGSVGGLLAGAVTMSVLKRNAPSISWKHMKPTVGIWAVSGPLGMLVSFGVAYLLMEIGVIAAQQRDTSCSGMDFSQCMGQMFSDVIASVAELIFLFCGFALLFMVVAWFLTGLFAGRWAVRRIRELEPGITAQQARGVSIGWGFGAVLAAIATIALLVFFFSLFSS